MSAKNILYCGTETLEPELIELKAGPVSMWFDPKTAFLKWLRLGDHEIVRAIYAAVRDENWGTVLPAIGNLQQEIKPDSFQLTFDMSCKRDHIDFFWRGTITGDSTGRVSYTFDGESRSAFQRNRIGICVLHPIAECSGKPCTVKHVDGTEEKGSFPKFIAPWQPFFDIKSLTYEAAPGAQAHIEFEGTVFEMEDQRNWSDASFKTYCTPQRLPKPVQVNPGDKVFQSVTVSGQFRPVLPVLQGRPPQISIATTPVLPLPPLGVSMARHGQALTDREIERLKALRLSHLRCDLDLATAHWPQELQRGVEASNALSLNLYLGLILGERPEEELPKVATEVGRLRPNIALWLVFRHGEESAGEKWVRLARQHLQACAPNVLFAAGTLDFFTEVNRNRPLPDSSAFPVFSLNPQVHAFDNNTMIENLAGQAYDAESAREFSSKPVVVSPGTLKIRDRNRAVLGPNGEMPTDVDPRQLSLFGAGWTLGSISRLASTGNIHSITYYETTGWRGLMELESGSLNPAKFPSIPGAVFPMYHLFADIAEWPIKQIYPTLSSHPLQAEAMTLFDNRGRRRILVANLLAKPQEIKIKTGSCQARIRYLDETNVEEAMRNPEAFRTQTGTTQEAAAGKIELKLLPYALARVDID
jgi:D-apionolactonase